jgi:electron transport complex protein RnfD
MEIIKENAPHLRRKDSLVMMMLDVIIALSPTIVFALVVYGLDALRNLLVPVATMVLCEFVYVLIKNRYPYNPAQKHTIKEQFLNGCSHYTWGNFLTPTVSGLIYGLIMPASTKNPGVIWYALVLGSVFGIVLGKLVFGGTGNNIFNPAALAMVFSKLCFGSQFVTTSGIFPEITYTSGSGDAATVITAGTSLSEIKAGYSDVYSLMDLFLGKVPGVIGETCKLCILVGFVYLIIRHAADWRITVSYIGSFAIMMLFAGIIYQAGGVTKNAWQYLAAQLLSGGLFFGAVFMATDPVSSPITRPGRVIYGCLLGLFTVIIRLFGALPEGVVFSILIGNMFTPLIDYYKWSSSKFTWKSLTIAASIVVVGILIVVWALCVEVL